MSAINKSQNDTEVASFVAQHAVRCPRCSYDLAGLTKARCPECGMYLTTPLLRDHLDKERQYECSVGRPSGRPTDPSRAMSIGDTVFLMLVVAIIAIFIIIDKADRMLALLTKRTWILAECIGVVVIYLMAISMSIAWLSAPRWRWRIRRFAKVIVVVNILLAITMFASILIAMACVDGI